MLPIMRQFVALFTLVLVTWAGIASATQAAPDRDSMARAQYLIATGASLADLCLTGEGDAALHCPLCHKLPEGPRLSHDGPVSLTRWTLPDLRQHDHVLHTDAACLSAAPRGPPVTL